ncbi:MAG: hypothetical protein GKR88_18930 [Flavobacteriaceae bacterium]|nr:MAG: hypothetical protein GKR88_18930 [Flavobacteriaceae bacterium]
MEILSDTVKTEIENWNQIRNTRVALNFLTSGSGFIIGHQDFLEWKKKNPKNINCYFAIDQFQLKFFFG